MALSIGQHNYTPMKVSKHWLENVLTALRVPTPSQGSDSTILGQFMMFTEASIEEVANSIAETEFGGPPQSFFRAWSLQSDVEGCLAEL